MPNISEKKVRDIKSAYIPEIDGLRAIAVLAVLIYHSGRYTFLKGGFTGVDIFFTISGYVISKSVYAHSYADFSSYISGFYSRRIRRILPALLVCLILTTLAATLFIPSSWLSNSIDDVAKSSFFGASNFYLTYMTDNYFSPQSEYIPLLHTWSLAIEEQFYLIFPVIFFFCLKYKDNRTSRGKLIWFSMIPLSVISLLISAFQTCTSPAAAFYLLPGRLWELAFGVIVFQLHTKSQKHIHTDIILKLFTLAGTLLIALSLIFADAAIFPFPWALSAVTGTAILLFAIPLNKGSSFTHRILHNSMLTYIGKRSYSLYLWHWPVAVLLKWTIGFYSYTHITLYYVFSIILTVISYKYIETPARYSKLISGYTGKKVILYGIILIIFTYFAASGIIFYKNQISLSITSDDYIWRSGNYPQDKNSDPAVQYPEMKNKQLFILGDSHSAAYRTMLNIASSQLGFTVFEYEAGGCAVAGLLMPLDSIENSRDFYSRSYDDILHKAHPGDIVFLASLRMPEIFGEDSEEGFLQRFYSEESETNRIIALKEADMIISDFEKLGIQVIIDAPLPVLKSQPYRCSDWFNKSNVAGRLGLTVDRAFLNQLRKPQLESLNNLKQKHENLFIWDPFSILCPGDTFSAFDKNGLPLFFDSDHLSAHGNRVLAPSFILLLKNIWLDKEL